MNNRQAWNHGRLSSTRSFNALSVAEDHAQKHQSLCKFDSCRFDMKFLLGKSDKISEPVLAMTKYLLSVLSIALTTGFVFVLETRV